jgi:hypothetical protein
MTGCIGSNDDAVTFLNERPLPGLEIDLIERATNAAKPPPTPMSCSPREQLCPRSSMPAPACLLAEAARSAEADQPILCRCDGCCAGSSNVG